MLPALAPASRPFDVVGLGEASLDLVVTLGAFPVPDGKMSARGQCRLPGGQVATAIRAADDRHASGTATTQNGYFQQ